MSEQSRYEILKRHLSRVPLWNLEAVEGEGVVTVWATSGGVRTVLCHIPFERAGCESLSAERKREAALSDAGLLVGMWGDLSSLLGEWYEPRDTHKEQALELENVALRSENKRLSGLKGARRSLLSAYKSLRVAIEKSGGFDE